MIDTSIDSASQDIQTDALFPFVLPANFANPLEITPNEVTETITVW